MSSSLIQTKIGSATGTTALNLALSSNTVAGDMIVIAITVAGGTDLISSVTSSGMTFTKITAASGADGGSGFVYMSLWYAYNVAAETTPTIVISKTSTAVISAVLHHYRGLTTTNPLDKTSKATAASSTAITSGSTAALSQANELVVGVGFSDFGSDTYTVGSGYGNLTSTSDGDDDLAMQDKVVSATTAVSSSMTLASASDNGGAVMTFLIASTGTTSTAGLTEAADVIAGTGALKLSGSSAITEANDIIAATGAETFTSTSAFTETGDVISGAGLYGAGGSGALQEAGDVIAGSGLQTFAISGSWTDSGDTIAGAGFSGTTGSAALTETGDVISGLGALVFTSSSAWTEAKDTIGGVGVSGFNIAGVVQDANDIIAAAGKIAFLSSSSITETGDVIAATSLSGADTTLISELQSLTIHRLVKLYQLDCTALGGQLYCFSSAIDASVHITSLSVSGLIVTVDTATPHLMETGDGCNISGVPQQELNGDYTITTLSPLSFTYQLPSAPADMSGTGSMMVATRLNGIMTFDGVQYTPVAFEATGFEWNGTGTQPTPTIRISNVSRLLMSAIITLNDLMGAKFTRIRTLRKHLDDGTAPDPTAVLPIDIYRVNRKSVMNKVYVEFELASPIDQQGLKIPGRVVLRTCCTQRYRIWNAALGAFDYSNATCPYASTPMFDVTGMPTSDPTKDVCSKQTGTGCRVRFGTNPLPTWAFPGIGQS